MDSGIETDGYLFKCPAICDEEKISRMAVLDSRLLWRRIVSAERSGLWEGATIRQATNASHEQLGKRAASLQRTGALPRFDMKAYCYSDNLVAPR